MIKLYNNEMFEIINLVGKSDKQINDIMFNNHKMLKQLKEIGMIGHEKNK